MGALLLLVAKARVEGQVSGPAAGMGQVAWNAGFWLCLATFAANAAFNAYLATAEPKVVRDDVAPLRAGPPRPFRGANSPVGRAYPTFGEEVPPPSRPVPDLAGNTPVRAGAVSAPRSPSRITSRSEAIATEGGVPGRLSPED